MSVFLTGTDTGVGKTFTAVCLVRLLRGLGLRCVGMKPICCGDRSDAEMLLAASSGGATLDELNPVWLRTPAAPFTAALIEDAPVDSARILAGLADLQKRYDFVVVEGVGGWLVPIDRDYFVSDLAVEMGLPVVVVAMNRLGCLNHTMLSVRSVAAHGLACRGVALNSPAAATDIALETNGNILGQIADVPILPGLSAETEELPRVWRDALGV